MPSGDPLHNPGGLLKLSVSGLVIMAAALIWTVIIPGFTASLGEVFYRDGLVDKLPDAAKERLREFEAGQAKRLKTLARIDDVFASANAPTDQIEPLIKLRGDILAEYEHAKAPISLAPFHLNPQLLLWPAIYTCVGWLVLLFRPDDAWSICAARNFRRVVLLGSLLYVVYEWPLWIRNFVLSNEGRTLYAYPNHDIHPASFFNQEIVVLGFCLLMAILWNQWIDFFEQRSRRPEARNGRVAESEWIRLVSGHMMRWQICSLVLAGGFLFFTHFFWTLVAKFQDQRYLLSAINAHLLWGVSWAFISLPLIETWKNWTEHKAAALIEVSSDPDLSEAERSVKRQNLLDLQPVSGVALSLSSLTAAASFLWPIISSYLT